MDRNNDAQEGPWTDILTLARRHLGMGSSMFYEPSIPPEKAANARRAHAMHLPEEETILALYDGTMFGGAQDGFLITPQRLCWKNFWEHPRQLPWDELDASTVSPQPGKILIA